MDQESLDNLREEIVPEVEKSWERYAFYNNTNFYVAALNFMSGSNTVFETISSKYGLDFKKFNEPE